MNFAALFPSSYTRKTTKRSSLASLSQKTDLTGDQKSVIGRLNKNVIAHHIGDYWCPDKTESAIEERQSSSIKMIRPLRNLSIVESPYN